MKKALAMGLLVVGLALAAAAGSRNGADHVAYRLAQAELGPLAEQVEGLNAQEAELESQAQAAKIQAIDWSLARAQEDGAAERAADAAGEAYEKPERVNPHADERAAVEAKLSGLSDELDDLTARKAELAQVKLPEPMTRLTQWLEAGGVGWFVGILMILAGAVMARQQLTAENSGQTTTAASDTDFLINLQQARQRLDQLALDLAELPMDDDAPTARQEIDAVFAELLEPIVDARGRFVARHGMGTFAGYFGSFAGGERNLSRTWSALTDGHAVEARASLDRARESFADAEAGWVAAEGQLTG